MLSEALDYWDSVASSPDASHADLVKAEEALLAAEQGDGAKERIDMGKM